MSGAKLLNRFRRASTNNHPPSSEDREEQVDLEAAEEPSMGVKRRQSIIRTTSMITSSLRLGKPKSTKATSSPPLSESVLYTLFTHLPTELHILILTHLSLFDILSLRLSSRRLHDIVAQCESSIVRHYITHVCTPLETFLYPPPSPGKATLQYLFDWSHRKHTSRKLAGQLCNFVAREILRRNTEKKRRQFDPTWQRMYTKLQPLLFTLNHFFESYRRTVLERCATNSRPGQKYSIQTGPALWEDQTQIMDQYDPILLLDLYHCYGFLLQAFERKLRPPSYATTFERYLRGWTAKPASAREIEILLMLGGMDKIAFVLAQSRYAERRKALSAFINSLSPLQSPDHVWKSAWNDLGVVSPKFPLNTIPTTRLAIPALHLIWVPNALNLLLEKDVIEHVDFGGDSGVRSMRDFVSEMVGYDILRYSGPPGQVATSNTINVAGEDDGSESEDLDSLTSDSDDEDEDEE